MRQLAQDGAGQPAAGQGQGPLQGGEAPLLTRSQWVDRRLRAAILSGELAPGERLRPADLAAAWQVSPTPLRAALLRLEADGLVETVPHRGTRVTPLTRTALHHLYEMRSLLEPLALRKSLERREALDDGQLRAALDALRSVHGDPPDPLAVEPLHRAFHRSLMSACDSPWLLSLVGTMSEHSSRYRLLSYQVRGGRQAIDDEHTALLEAVLAADQDAACALLTTHLRRTLDVEPLLPEESP